MRCGVCQRSASIRLPFNCVLCTQLAVYKPRIALVDSLLGNETLEKEVEQQTADTQKCKASKPGPKVQGLHPALELERAKAEQLVSNANTDNIMPQIKALRGELQHMKLDIAKRKAKLVRRRKDQTSAREELVEAERSSRAALEGDVKDVCTECELLHQRSARERLIRCKQTARMLSLRQHTQQKGSRPRDVFSIGYLPIPDLRELNNVNHQHATASLLYVSDLVSSTARHLALRLPAQILLPTSEYTCPTILSPNVSYTTSKPILPIPFHSKQASPAASRHADRSTQPRARPLFLRKRLAALSKDNPREYAYAVEGITLLAWDIAWLCKTQGIDVGAGSWDEICAMGKNLYDLHFPSSSVPNNKAFLKPSLPSEPKSLPPQPAYFSHGTAYGFLGSGKGSKYMHDWRLSNPLRVIEKIKAMLLAERTGAEWELLENNEWNDEESQDQVRGDDVDEKSGVPEQQTSELGIGATGILVKPKPQTGPQFPGTQNRPLDEVDRRAKGWYRMRER